MTCRTEDPSTALRTLSGHNAAGRFKTCMTCRIENGEWFIHEYNTETCTELVEVIASPASSASPVEDPACSWRGGDCTSPGNYAAKWDFAYDGDGVRVATLTTPCENGSPQSPVLTAYYFGGMYEVTGRDVRKYYSFGGQTVAIHDGTGLQYFLSDHLGSIVAVTDENGTLISQQRYLPFGAVRAEIPSPQSPITDLGYTGQRDLDGTGLMDYKFRFYSPTFGRFISPDNIIPDTTNPQTFNRYSYVNNRPINFNDPTGHDSIPSNLNEFAVGFVKEVISSVMWFHPQIQTDLAPSENESVAMLAGRVVGDIASMVIGTLAVGTGGGAMTGGTLCAGLTGGGCLPVGAPTVVAGAALALEGAGMGVRGAVGLGGNIVLLANKYKRSEYGGSRTTNNPNANNLRKQGEYKPCPECGNLMVPGTKHAPSPDHNPSLVRHFWEHGGKNMSYEERVAYAQSKKAFSEAICLTCQRRQGGLLAQFSRLMNKLFGQ
jgi:RHS repeat-associated protein